MGEVGTNSADNPHVDWKMNGGINGSCDDELNAMEIDTSNAASETIAKDVNSPDVQNSPADNNEMDSDSGSSLDDVSKAPCEDDLIAKTNDHEQTSDQNPDDSESHENGATEAVEEPDSKMTCDRKPGDDEEEHELSDCLMEKDEFICDDGKLIDENDPVVKVLSDPLSMDVDFMDDDKRTNHSRPMSTENGTSATVTSSSNDERKFLS